MAPKGGNLLKNNAPSSKNGSSRQLLRKGPWTIAEDAMLIEYVKKHGEGNWNAVQRNSRLMRCGKSCRLRWANHLRPNLKKGAFSPEEERLIIELHAKFGNKWARMAAQLPGRTDNEIKNYWNTRLKRRLRAGLPIYPQHMNQPHQHHQQQQQILQPNSSSSSLSSLLSSEPQNTNHNPSVSMLDMSNVNPLSAITKNSLNQPENSYLSSPDHQLKLYRDNNGSLALSLLSSSPNSPFSSTSTPLPFLSQAPSPPLTTALPSVFGSLSFGNNPPPFIGFSYNQSDLLVSGMGIELPSIQSPTLATTRTSSTNDHTVPNLSRGYSGLLQDLLAESQALARAEKSKESLAMEEKDKGKSVMDYGLVEAKGHNAHQESTFSFGFGYATSGKPPEDSTMGTKTNKGSVEGINPVDDDLLSLLDNFPLAVPVPNWYDEIGHGSGGEVLSSFINGNVGITDHVEKEASPLASASSSTRNNDSNIGSCFWNNMPDIYEH